jgi:uncharacterized protein YkwD
MPSTTIAVTPSKKSEDVAPANSSQRGSSGLDLTRIPIATLLSNCDLDGDGDVDKDDASIAAVLKKIDENGDGYISLRELVHLGPEILGKERKIRGLKRIMIAVVLGAVLLCLTMFGVMIAANETSKDTAVITDGTGKAVLTDKGTDAVLATSSEEFKDPSKAGGLLLDANRENVATGRTEEAARLRSDMPITTLQGLEYVTITSASGTEHLFKVAGFARDASSSTLEIFTLQGDTIRVRGADVAVTAVDDAAASELRKAAMAPLRKRRQDSTSDSSSIGVFSIAAFALVPPDESGFVEAHNKLRTAVGLPPMVADASIQAHARDWAQQLQQNDCAMAHSSWSRRQAVSFADGTQSGVGENLYLSNYLSPSWDDIASAWWEEVKDYNYAPHKAACEKRSADAVIGHFTQMAWQCSVYVGCATVSCGSKLLGVCNYGQVGNFVGDLPFPPAVAAALNKSTTPCAPDGFEHWALEEMPPTCVPTGSTRRKQRPVK